MTRARFAPTATARPGDMPRIRSGLGAMSRDVLSVATRPVQTRARLANFRRPIAG